MVFSPIPSTSIEIFKGRLDKVLDRENTARLEELDRPGVKAGEFLELGLVDVLGGRRVVPPLNAIRWSEELAVLVLGLDVDVERRAGWQGAHCAPLPDGQPVLVALAGNNDAAAGISR